MKQTSNYRTKTNFKARNNGHLDGIWEIALDVGYSAVKNFSPNSYGRFPYYAKKVDDSFYFTGNTRNAIMYQDLTSGEKWIVGEIAQDLISNNDTTDSEASLYGRDRFDSPMFHVLSETGLGTAMRKNEFGDPASEKIVIQTGLPEKYMEDETAIKESLCGEHHFALKLGDRPWEEYHFDANMNDIYVMPQPKGTLFSVCIDKNGQFHPDAQKYLSSSVIVFDAGFGTLDIFPILKGSVDDKLGQTFHDLGMKRILHETSKEIKKRFKVDIPVPAMQKALMSGTVRYMDKKNFKSTEYQFGDILADATKRICEEAIARTAGVIDLLDYNYMIVTGGTGAAWYNQICEKFKDFSTLSIIKGNQNDDLPFVYGNVRGYYFYRYNLLGQKI